MSEDQNHDLFEEDEAPQRKSMWIMELGEVFGIPVRLHLSIFLLFGYVLFASSSRMPDSSGQVALMLLSIFVAVFLHELGHSFAARAFRIQVKDITIWALGGIARMERVVRPPHQHIIVSLAGPAVNITLAMLLGTYIVVVSPDMAPHTSFQQLVFELAQMNLILGLFNLIPALPMDGGRVLKSLLSMTSLRDRSSKVAARIGQGFAIAMGILGLITGYFWLLILAPFFFLSAEREWQVDNILSRFAGTKAWQAMLKPVATAGRMTSIGSLVKYASGNKQQDFPIMEGESVVGVVTRWSLMDAMEHGHQDDPVFTIMDHEVHTLSPFDSLDKLLQTSLPIDRLVLPVVHKMRVVGLVTPDQLQEIRGS
ncbi:MAG: site-2 protease family protein [Deltaproteobacteria bacterium]|nr:site-2 protease family protein [Deltaproteobacteria bacterium]